MTQEEAKAKILAVLPHLRHAMVSARSEEGAVAQIGILAVKPGGSGRVVAQFRAEEFVHDLCVALGESTENTDDEELDAEAVKLLQKFGITS